MIIVRAMVKSTTVLWVGLDSVDVGQLRKGNPVPVSENQARASGLNKDRVVLFHAPTALEMLTTLEGAGAIPQGEAYKQLATQTLLKLMLVSEVPALRVSPRRRRGPR